MSIRAAIPSPSESVWHLGPIPVRAYALAIICGIVIAGVVLSRRYRARGGPAEVVPDAMVVMVICGIVGGRLYHVVTDYELYFGQGRNPLAALYVWQGGLGIWGAITLGGVGAYAFCRHNGLRLGPFGDAIAPALLLAQAVGRLGNYFNQELYGRPTDLPWALRIDDAHLVPGYAPGTTFHPTFLYELLWCAAGALLLVWLERRFDLRGGQAFACYVMIYTSGRVWIEYLRIDASRQVLGLRLNVWTSILVFAGAAFVLVLLRRRLAKHPELDDIWVSDEARQRFEAKLGDAGASAAREQPAAESQEEDQEAAESQAAVSGESDAEGQAAANGESDAEGQAAARNGAGDARAGDSSSRPVGTSD